MVPNSAMNKSSQRAPVRVQILFEVPERLAEAESREGSLVTLIQSLIKWGFELPKIPTYPKLSMMLLKRIRSETNAPEHEASNYALFSSTKHPRRVVSSNVNT